jgi:CubicO group peptidase (beta-lactamase class C family)
MRPRMYFARLFALALIGLLTSQSVQAQEAGTPAQSPPLDAQKIREYMDAATRINRFSGSILVARDGQPIVAGGYGMANYELDVPNTTRTVFRLGSLTKQFTATAVVILQERGKLKTGDSICALLADCPASWRPVTIRHLLTHTSGIPDYTRESAVDLPRAQPFTQSELIALFKDKPLEFPPGDRFSPSNSGYYLLGVIIERASGRSYEEFLQEAIFRPLQMASTGYDRTSRVIKNRASGYGVRGDDLVNAPYIDMSSAFAAGGLYSTGEDLLLWNRALEQEKLLSRASRDELFTAFKGEHAYGWYRRKRLDRQVLEHDGNIGGFFSSMTRFIDDRVTVIVLGNTARTNTRGVANDLSAIVFGAPYSLPQQRTTITLDPALLQKYAGDYQQEPGVVVTIAVEDGRLMRRIGAQPAAELSALSETEFLLKGIDLPITFVVDAQGRVTGYVTRRGGREVMRPKIK